MEDIVAKQGCSELAQLLGVIYTSICSRIRDIVKYPPSQHEITTEVYSAKAPPENARYEVEETIHQKHLNLWTFTDNFPKNKFRDFTDSLATMNTIVIYINLK